MKITTTELKQLIQEEYQKLNTEADDKRKTPAEAQEMFLALRQSIVGAGITDIERDIILDFMEIAINFAMAKEMNSAEILTPLNTAVEKMRKFVSEPEEKSQNQ